MVAVLHPNTRWMQWSIFKNRLYYYWSIYLRIFEIIASPVMNSIPCIIIPNFMWDAMLKHTRVNFKFFIDVHIVLFIERGTRGGLNQCSNMRRSNKYMQKQVHAVIRSMEIVNVPDVFCTLTICTIRQCINYCYTLIFTGSMT